MADPDWIRTGMFDHEIGGGDCTETGSLIDLY